MTKQEEIHANAAVRVMQFAWEMMANKAIEATTEAEIIKAHVAELQAEIDALKKPQAPQPEATSGEA